MGVVQYVYGADTYGARHYIGQLAATAGADITWLEGTDLHNRSLAAIVAETTGLFGRQLPVLYDPTSWAKGVQEMVRDYIKTHDETESVAVVLWDRGEPNKKSVLWRALGKQGQHAPALSVGQLSTWADQLAAQLGMTVEYEAKQVLFERLGADRWRWQSELQRLALRYTTITGQIVIDELPLVPQAEIFALLDALVAGRLSVVMRQLTALQSAGHGEFYILSMLGYQFRTLAALAVAMRQQPGADQAGLAKQLGVHPYVVQKSMSLVQQRSLPAALWQHGLMRVAATELAIKQGKVGAETAIPLLLHGLAKQISQQVTK